MFPVTLKWIDDICDKVESMYNQVDDIIFKDQESSKYVEGLKNVGTNVKQFYSTMDPLKYVEDQLQSVGTKVEQLYSNVVPSSVDTVVSAVDNIFIEQDADSTECKKSELKGQPADNDDSLTEAGVFKSELTDDQIDDDESMTEHVESESLSKNNQVYNNDSMTETIAFESELKDNLVEDNNSKNEPITSKLEVKDHQVDNDNSKNGLAAPAEMVKEVVSAGKFKKSNLHLEDIVTETDNYFYEESSPVYDHYWTDEGPTAKFGTSGSYVSSLKVECQEKINANEKTTQSTEKVQLDESYVVINKNDWFISQVAVGNKSPKIKLPSASTLKLRLIQRSQQIKNKTKSKISEQEYSIQMEQAVAVQESSPNNNTWESEWEIV